MEAYVCAVSTTNENPITNSGESVQESHEPNMKPVKMKHDFEHMIGYYFETHMTLGTTSLEWPRAGIYSLCPITCLGSMALKKVT